MKMVVIIPTYNEAATLGSLLPLILEQDERFEVLVVDDNSPDGTGEIASQMALFEPRIHVLHRRHKEGLGPAYIAGFNWALDYGAELIFQMDADLSHDPKALPAFLQAIDEGADLVIGSRYTDGGRVEDWSWWRRLISRGGSLYASTILGSDISDMTSGFKCYRRAVLEGINLADIEAKGYGFQIETVYRSTQAGFDVQEIPITFTDRQVGRSKMSKAIFWEAVKLVPALRFGHSASPLGQELAVEQTSQGALKILLVVSEAPPIKSGISRVAAELQSGLQALGHEVDILSSVDIPRYSFGEIRLSTFIFHWSRLRDRLANYDLINVHAPAPTFSDLFLLLASQFGWHPRKNRLVMTYQCEIDLPGMVIKPLSSLYSWLHKQMARLVGHTIVTTPSYAEMFEGTITDNQLSIIPWAVDESAFGASIEDKPSDTFRVLFIGQLRPYKGLDVLLRAMQKVSEAELYVIGGGHHADSYTQLAADLKLDHVSFLGKVSDGALQAALQDSHVLVLPSRTKAEAFGLVLLEAMAAGCVPIASDLPGVRDVVAEVGFTFPVDDWQTLGALLSYLRMEPELVKRYARKAQAKARDYTWERSVEAHDRLFRQLIVSQEVADAVQKGQSYEMACLERLAAHLQASASTLYQQSPIGYQLRPMAFYGQAWTWAPRVIYQDGGVAVRLEQEETMLLSNHVNQSYLAGEGSLAARSTLVTTLRTPDQRQHLLCFGRALNQPPFTIADREWLESIIAQLDCGAVSNAEMPRIAKSLPIRAYQRL